MTVFALVAGQSPVRLWSLDAHERIRRQLQQAGEITLLERAEALDGLPGNARVLLLRADYLYEVRTLTAMLERRDSALFPSQDGQPAAANVDAAAAADTLAALTGQGAVPEHLEHITPEALDAFDHQLRKAKPPLLEPVTEDRRDALEALLYGSAYKGITDLVTKFVWPRPARHGVRLCARLGITPNTVTTVGFLLMVWACYLFAEGQFALGLAAGWIMTYLDTVDGKLARVTVRSSRFGHLFDHGMDVIHPPFWYVFWGTALAAYQPVLGLELSELYWLVVGGYVLGRIAEALFHLLGDASIFSWRPFDAYFRLVTARRNPCMILLTLSVLAGRPDWGLVSVALWTAGTTGILLLRLLQGCLVRLRKGPLQSWLADPTTAAALHPGAYRLFSGTQSAYAAD